jgi:hypothetical protein
VGLLSLSAIAVARAAGAPATVYERTFPESKKAIQEIVVQMQGTMSGRLPVLDGFAVAGEHSLDKYQRGFYQATVQVTPTEKGAVVHVSAKITAWYGDSVPSRSGYQLLSSNGRIEMDILDQLSERLAAADKISNDASTVKRQPAPFTKAPANVISAPEPQSSAGIAASSSPSSSSSLSSPLPRDFGARDTVRPENSERKTKDPEQDRVRAELDQLQEALRNQGHPKNLVAVRKSGTSVVATPSLTAKPLFLASAHDEFEIINFNQDWVHVKISGLSRGWLWRNDVEMPDAIPDVQSAPKKQTAADIFRVVKEETAPFPGDWEPLRGTTVKVISVQKSDETAKDGGPAMKLEFAKSVFGKSYAELTQHSGKLAGIVLIFDSADGGMIAAPQSILEKWKSGAVTDAALWRSCFFDPPETFAAPDAASSH